MAAGTIWRRKARASAIFLCCASCRLASSFTEEVTWDVENRKPPPLFRVRLEIRLDKDLNGLLAGMHFDADRCIAEIHFICDHPFHELWHQTSSFRSRFAPTTLLGRGDLCTGAGTSPVQS